jgi:glycerophosphoryl diester phosphodiesterase
METRVHRAPGLPSRKRKKRDKLLIKIIFILAILMILGYLALFLIVIPERPDRPFFEGVDRPLVIAQRGGSSLAPENTLIAFERALQLGVDAIQFDVRISKDGHLVVIQHDTVDLTTEGEGRVTELTLAELKSLDAAYTFQDIRGHYIYRNQGITIPTLEEVFQTFSSARMLIEVKVPDLSEDEVRILPEAILQGKTVEEVMADRLWQMIDQYGMQDQVIVTSFNDQFINHFQVKASGKVPVAAARQETTRFVFLNKLFLDRLYRPSADVIILPQEYNIIDLRDQRLIEGAHRFNMPIIYFEINEEQVIRDLLKKGADGIVTDRPDLLIRIINEMEEYNGEN